jgi:hypothetical protein
MARTISAGNGIAGAAGVAHHEVLLELREFVFRNAGVCQRAEAGVHAVDRRIALLQAVAQVGMAALYGGCGVGAERDGASCGKDVVKLGEFEADGSYLVGLRHSAW